MRCDECRHWHKEKDSHHAIRDLGECIKAVQLWDATEWAKDADGEEDYAQRAVIPSLIDQMSFVQDGSDYHASLYTKAHFFCAHFAE